MIFLIRRLVCSVLNSICLTEGIKGYSVFFVLSQRRPTGPRARRLFDFDFRRNGEYFRNKLLTPKHAVVSSDQRWYPQIGGISDRRL